MCSAHTIRSVFGLTLALLAPCPGPAWGPHTEITAAALLHFIQDFGSPPHTTGISEELHGQMERWVEEKQITLASYTPCLLGKTGVRKE